MEETTLTLNLKADTHGRPTVIATLSRPWTKTDDDEFLIDADDPGGRIRHMTYTAAGALLCFGRMVYPNDMHPNEAGELIFRRD